MKNIFIADILGHIGNVGFMLGAFLIARKKKEGFYALIWGNSFYILQGLVIGTTSLVLISLYLLSMNIYGCYNWKNEK